MKQKNLISILNSSNLQFNDQSIKEGFDLATHEANTLKAFINELHSSRATVSCYNGYFASYRIKQISKEFDLLRFCHTSIINIELKSCLDVKKRDSKITRQMSQNHYYLKFLNLDIMIYTFIENDGLYFWDNESHSPIKVDFAHLITNLESQTVNCTVNPDNLFVPRNYLISTFNDTNKFLKGDYFLTDHQLEIKKEIMKCKAEDIYKLFCISANAGTGKTLLAYDIAKELIESNNNTIIIHCGQLNEGHSILRSHDWNIISIRDVTPNLINNWNEVTTDVLIIDESHRISTNQLNQILKKSIECNIPIIFLYDIKQYLRDTETKDIYDYLQHHYEALPKVKKTLKSKIRTNKDMASFITNLMHIGKSKTNLNYENITIEYFENLDDVKNYLRYLKKNEGWEAITFSNSLHTPEPIDTIANLCATNAHNVIGQEFDKVVFVMDTCFKYGPHNNLMAKTSYYSTNGMLYQIVTRVVSELKIIVFKNADLFSDLLKIKHQTFLTDEVREPPNLLK